MKGLLTKKHYCYKVHTSLMTSSAYPPSVDNPLYGLPPPPPPFLQEKLDSALQLFFKNPTPTNRR